MNQECIEISTSEGKKVSASGGNIANCKEEITK